MIFFSSPPIISIIIPCFNQEFFLPETINSILNQSHQNWECIIVNDGSTDNSKDIAINICQQDNRIHYIEQENQGLSAARNAGLEKATGKYIQFLDADDILLPSKLEKQIHELEKCNDLCLSICDYYYCAHNDHTKPILEKYYLPPYFDRKHSLHDLILFWEEKLSIPAHCFLFDTRFFTQQGIRFNTALPNHEDWDCWISIFSLNPTVLFTNEKLVAYRVHSTSMSRDINTMYIGFIMTLYAQKIKFISSPYLLDLLSIKERSIKHKFITEEKKIAFKDKKNNLLKLYRNYIPWPIQKLLANLF